MKIPIRFLSAAWMLMVLSGCAARKAADHSGSDPIEHAQAVKAIEQRRFRIDLDEIFFRSGKAPISVIGSYISLDGDHGIMRFVPTAFPRSSLGNLYFEGDHAEFTMEKIKKNGELQFRIKIYDREYTEKKMRKRFALITLYAGSNRCLIQFWGADFRGRLYPLEE